MKNETANLYSKLGEHGFEENVFEKFEVWTLKKFFF